MFSNALVTLILFAGVLVMAVAALGAIAVCRADDERNDAIYDK